MLLLLVLVLLVLLLLVAERLRVVSCRHLFSVCLGLGLGGFRGRRGISRMASHLVGKVGR